MSTLAINIRMQGKMVLVVGGGAVALRKLNTLLRVGASIRVVAIKICPEISALNVAGALSVRIGDYSADDLDGAFMVIAATDNTLANEQVRSDAAGKGILVAVSDNPEAGDCTFPATLQRGDLEIAVSTGGRCPTFAVDVRESIAEYVGKEYGAILDQLAREREKLLTNGSPSTYDAQVLHSLARRLLNEFIERKELLP